MKSNKEEKQIIQDNHNVEVVSNEMNELFPNIEIPEIETQEYQKIPLAGLGALGVAFAQLPESARIVVKTTQSLVKTNETLFVGFNPKNIAGFLIDNGNGTVGNIMQINEQGKNVIAGRMRFKPVDAVPVETTTTTTLPFDPTLMVVAVAVMAIEQKLDAIQKSVDKVLSFLEEKEQAEVRGNMITLSEIVSDYKIKGSNKDFCRNRDNIVQSIQNKSIISIELYQNMIGKSLNENNAFWMVKEEKKLVENIIKNFANYQMACYNYAYSTFLDVVLRKDFDTVSLENCRNKMETMANKYNELYSMCYEKIADRQRNSLENKIKGGTGIVAKNLGKAIGSIPVIEKGPVDEALLEASKSLGESNKKAVAERLHVIEQLKDSRMKAFEDSLLSIDYMYNKPNSMITDGENLYVLRCS